MGERRYTLKELRKMSLKSLEEVGGELGLSFTKNHNRVERSRRICSAYAAQDVSTRETEGESPVSSSASSPSNLHESKPRFEQLCADGEQPSGPTSEGRGGAREGAGRPAGVTGEVLLYRNMPQYPHPAIQHFMEMAFEAWSVRCHCPEVALTKDQAFELALPWTRAAYLAGINEKIPPWLVVVIECTWTTWSVIAVKAGLARDAAAERKKVESMAKSE